MENSCCYISLPSCGEMPKHGEITNGSLERIKKQFGQDLSYLKEEMLEAEYRHECAVTYFGRGRYRCRADKSRYNVIIETHLAEYTFLLFEIEPKPSPDNNSLEDRRFDLLGPVKTLK